MKDGFRSWKGSRGFPLRGLRLLAPQRSQAEQAEKLRPPGEGSDSPPADRFDDADHLATAALGRSTMNLYEEAFHGPVPCGAGYASGNACRLTDHPRIAKVVRLPACSGGPDVLVQGFCFRARLDREQDRQQIATTAISH